ncbi:MAG: UDP-glucose 4-epimerase GalE [Beijerinckiaceae bacterium]|nr:UDP-glucose 4-epimerase GalE [Beijerinckiaceae bacterium]
MTVLVTGGAGYIGSHMVLELLEAGEKVVVLDNLSTGFAWAVPEGVPLVVGDFGDEAVVSQLLREHGVSEIIHFAAKIVVPESVADPLGYYLNNTAMARSLIACAVAHGVKHFIFSSTAAVYGDPAHSPVGEDEPLHPMSPYGRSKLMVEWMLEDVSRAHAMSHVVLRYFNVAGADPKGRVGQSTPDATHLIKVAVQSALGFRPGMEVFGTDYPTPDGSGVRDFIQVTDLARAHLDALRYLRTGGPSLTCNVGYQRGYSVLEVIKLVKEISGVDFPVTLSPRRPGDVGSIVASNARIRSQLGWIPKHDDLRAILQQALDWERRLHNRSEG